MFVLHFGILNRSGPGDAQMSSLFQSRLIGNNFGENPLEIAYGSVVSIKNTGRGGGLLHSHIQRFPGGSEQQQVTCYSHKDNNNEFRIERAWGGALAEKDEVPQFIKSADMIRLVHVATKKNLHSHEYPAPVTEGENEVTCFGTEEMGDDGDHWYIERYDVPLNYIGHFWYCFR